MEPNGRRQGRPLAWREAERADRPSQESVSPIPVVMNWIVGCARLDEPAESERRAREGCR